MTKLEIVKTLVELEQIRKLGQEGQLSTDFVEHINTSYEILTSTSGINLDDKNSTKPRKLYGCTYSNMDKAKYNEYTQIKRILQKRKQVNL